MSKTIGVIGAGTMGNGIAQVAARAGFDVVMRDVSEDFLKRGLAAIDKSLQRDVDKARLSGEDKQQIVARVRTATALDDLAGCDFVVEAITENLEAKTDLFRQLDRLARPDVILATNTSSISITKLAAATARPVS